MRRGPLVTALGLTLLALVGETPRAPAQAGGTVQWIWSKEGDPATEAPAGTRYFRKAFPLSRQFADEATLDVTADAGFTVWLNGTKLGRGDDWKRVYAFDIKKHLVEGKNV